MESLPPELSATNLMVSRGVALVFVWFVVVVWIPTSS